MTARTIRFARLSAILNAALALGKIGLGVYSLSVFVCVSGFYNVGIAFAKHITIKDHERNEQSKSYIRIGYIILATSAVYMIYCANMVIRGEANITYDLITALAIATFTFTEIGVSIYGILIARRTKSLTFMSVKRINLVSALVSLVLTESALLGIEGVSNAARYCGWTGLICGGISAIIGLSMVILQGRHRISTGSEECAIKHIEG
jgi:hypothetical protein